MNNSAKVPHYYLFLEHITVGLKVCAVACNQSRSLVFKSNLNFRFGANCQEIQNSDRVNTF